VKTEFFDANFILPRSLKVRIGGRGEGIGVAGMKTFRRVIFSVTKEDKSPDGLIDFTLLNYCII
jgi:hypothetical protein